MKKLSYLILSVLAVAVALVFSGCGSFAKSNAEKKLVEEGEFVAKSNYEETTLSVKADKTFSLYVYSYETKAMKTYEGTWSYVLTYKFKYTVTHDPAELIKTTEHSKWEIFKLDGYTDRGKQGYFVLKEYGGIIHTTAEEMNKDYFEQYKAKNGLVSLPGWDVKSAPKD